MKFYREFPLNDQPYDAYQKLVESLDDTNIWKGHISIKNIDESTRESVLAFRQKKQIEKIDFNKNDRSVIIKYGNGPIKGFQIIQVQDEKILIIGKMRMRGIWFPFTGMAMKHILKGEMNALSRLFPSSKKD
ncbi:MAG: hypothetical protein ACP5RG_01970 [Thermoplasmata archaeon]